MASAELVDIADKVRVRGVELDVGCDGHPLNTNSVVTGMQLELAEDGPVLVVEVHRAGLHPAVVGVAWVVDRPTVDLDAVGKELAEHLLQFDALLRRCLERVERLLTELLAERQRDGVTSLDHATGNRPLAGIAALDRDELEDAATLGVQGEVAVVVLLPARDNGVGGVVGAKATEQTLSLHPCATPRVVGKAALVELVLAGVADAVDLAVHRVELDGRQIRAVVGPDGQLGPTELLVIMNDGGVAGELHIPGDLVIRDMGASWTVEVGPIAALHVDLVGSASESHDSSSEKRTL